MIRNRFVINTLSVAVMLAFSGGVMAVEPDANGNILDGSSLYIYTNYAHDNHLTGTYNELGAWEGGSELFIIDRNTVNGERNVVGRAGDSSDNSVDGKRITINAGSHSNLEGENIWIGSETTRADRSTAKGSYIYIGFYADSEDNLAEGTHLTIDGKHNTNIGNSSSTNGDYNYQRGDQTVINGSYSTAIGNEILIDGSNSYGLGNNLRIEGDNIFKIGGQRVSNIAAGVNATDGVNLGQMTDAFNGLSDRITALEGGTPVPGPGPGPVDPDAASRDYVDGKYEQALSFSKSYTDKKVKKAEKTLSAGISQVAAQPMIPSLEVGEKTVAVGTGHYNGSHALGIAAAYSPREGVVVGAGTSFSDTSSKSLIRTSASFKWK